MRANFQGGLSPVPPKAFAPPVIRQDVACYRILKMCYLDDVACFEGDIVYWPDEPNKEMEPLNDLARKASTAFFDNRDELAKKASEAKGVRYIPNRRPVDEERALNTAEARRVEVVKGDGGIPVLGARRRPRAEKAMDALVEQKPVTDFTRRGRDVEQ